MLPYALAAGLLSLAAGRTILDDPATLDSFVFAQELKVPPTMPKTNSAPEFDYYEVGVRQVETRIVPGLKTKVFAYGAVSDPNTFQTPGPTIVAKTDRPVRVKWVNQLMENNKYLPHLLPVDQTLHWANPAGGLERRDTAGVSQDNYTGPVPTITHVHGHLSSAWSDGYPEAWYLPSARDVPLDYAGEGSLYLNNQKLAKTEEGIEWTRGSATFQYDNKQKPGFLWYHDHALGLTRTNVYAGLAGAYMLEDESPSADVAGIVGLPTIPLVLQDKTLYTNGDLYYPGNRADFEGLSVDQLRIPFKPKPACNGRSDVNPIWNPEFFGLMNIVNGVAWPYVDIAPGCHRFRILNGANSRPYEIEFRLEDETVVPFVLVATEGGYLDGNSFPTGRTLEKLRLDPAERADIILYLDSSFKGKKIEMRNTDDTADTTRLTKIMRINVENTLNLGSCPEFKLPGLPVLANPVRTRDLTLYEFDSKTVLVKTSGANTVLDCNSGTPFGPVDLKLGDGQQAYAWDDPITEYPRAGTTEQWNIRNPTMDTHPIHTHDVFMRVVGRKNLTDGSALPLLTFDEGTVKDTYVVESGTELSVQMEFSSKEGLFAWHCHILEHEDNEMMRPFCALPASGVLPRGCQLANGGEECLIKLWHASEFLCVTVDGEGPNVVLKHCTGADNQLWSLDADNQIRSVKVINGEEVCLWVVDDDRYENEFRKNVIVWPCATRPSNAEPNQLWKADRSIQPYFVRTLDENYCLEWDDAVLNTRDAGFGQFSNVVVRPCSFQSAVWIWECDHVCIYDEWNQWSDCSELCGGGYRTRHRQPVYNQFVHCTDIMEQEACNNWACESAEMCIIIPLFDPLHQRCMWIDPTDNQLRVKPCTGEDSQLWIYDGRRLELVGRIQGERVCITVRPDLSLKAWPCLENDPLDAQKFDRYYNSFVHVGTGLCMDIFGGVDWQLSEQPVGLWECHGYANQEWLFQCVQDDICVNFCPGHCTCFLDAFNQPVCDCPGGNCYNHRCLNGGYQYYDGTVCRCRCPGGFQGDFCTTDRRCEYTEWTAWTECTKPCGAGRSLRTRFPLSYPEICIEVTEYEDCNVHECDQYGGFAGCYVEAQGSGIGGPMQCLTMVNGYGTVLQPCSGNVGQRWSWNGDMEVRSAADPNLCTDIEGGFGGSRVIVWPCHGHANQHFMFNDAFLQAETGQCVGIINGQAALVQCSAVHTWAVNCNPQYQPIPCEYDQWTEWSPCSATCGEGSRTRHRGILQMGTEEGCFDTVENAGCFVRPCTQEPPIGGKSCHIELQGTGRCVDVEGGNVILANCDLARSSQRWSFAGNVLRTEASGRCMDISGGMSGYNVITWDCHGDENQQFYQDGTMILGPGGNCLDVEGGFQGQNIIVWPCHGGDNQKFMYKCDGDFGK